MSNNNLLNNKSILYNRKKSNSYKSNNNNNSNRTITNNNDEENDNDTIITLPTPRSVINNEELFEYETEEDWKKWESSYRDYILYYARLAETEKVLSQC